MLGATTSELNLTTVSRLAKVSPAQTSRVLPHLVDLGIVTRRDVPPTALFTLNRDHIAAPAVELLLRPRELLVDRIRASAGRIRPKPLNITLFGSIARGSGGPDSDIDLAVIRPDGIAAEDPDWVESMIRWEDDVRSASGNTVNVIEVTDGELRSSLRSRASFWREVAEQGITVMGRSISELAHTR